MGSLNNFHTLCKPISLLKHKYNTDTFVETGCFRGAGLFAASSFGFKKLYSCDIDKEMVDLCQGQFKDVDIYHTDSLTFLEELLPTLDDIESVFFFLDAHLPDHDKNNGTVLLDSEYNFPLEKELDLIYSYRKDKRDIILCDDLRIYEDGPFQGGNWKERHKFGLDLSFISRYNYNIEKFYKSEGYILLYHD